MNTSFNYKQIIEMCVCNIENYNCMMGHCDSCPNPLVLKSFLRNELLQTIDPDEAIRFTQWISTDRSQLVDEELEFEDFIENLMDKFEKLTVHHYVSKKEAEFFKQPKNVCVIVLDFAENYSFLVQDAAQGFHWNNSQGTIHPFVIYYGDVSGKLNHKS